MWNKLTLSIPETRIQAAYKMWGAICWLQCRVDVVKCIDFN